MKEVPLEARIRKFKEQQERKKREEEEKRAQEKLQILEHRALQGDRKAKQQLNKFKQLEDEQSKFQQQPGPSRADYSDSFCKTNQIKFNNNRNASTSGEKVKSGAKPALKSVEVDFDELMKLAKQNKNELKKPPPPKEPEPEPAKPLPRAVPKVKVVTNPPNLKAATIPAAPITVRPALKPNLTSTGPKYVVQAQRINPNRPMIHNRPISTTNKQQHNLQVSQRPPQQPPLHFRSRYNQLNDDEEEEEEEDDYEVDDFVVDDDEEDAQDELRKTLKSVFRYDRRRCDLREQEIDRQYRAIGKVSTIEDLEREERRAERLAADEDARAFKEEKERKRLKKIRLNKS